MIHATRHAADATSRRAARGAGLPPLAGKGRHQATRAGPPPPAPAAHRGDKGYSSRAIRALCRQRGIRTTIPHRTNEHRSGPFDRTLYRLRHKVECLLNRAKQYRSLATRYEKRGDSFRTMWVIVATILWI